MGLDDAEGPPVAADLAEGEPRGRPPDLEGVGAVSLQADRHFMDGNSLWQFNISGNLS